jgi:tetratricopeptide (TPR) repeat protein
MCAVSLTLSKEIAMKSYHVKGWAALPRTVFVAAFLLSASITPVISWSKADGEKPAKRAGDEDPPLPSKKSQPTKQVRVEVTAASAEVRTGDKVITTVTRGQVLPFTKKSDEYYLVIVNGEKGWIKKEAVREVEVVSDTPGIEVPPGPAPAAIDKDRAHKVKQATAYLRVRLADGNTVEGSGFFAVQPGLVLTNAHVLGMLSPGSATPAEVRVVVHSGEAEEFTLPAEVLNVDRDNDLGVLRVKGRAARLPPPLPVDTTAELALVQKVYIFGFPFGTSLGKDITASESSVSSIRKEGGIATQLQVNGGMHRGNSGGPVVDSRGVVVGVAVSAIRGTQINFAVPGDRVLDLLRGRVARTQHGEAFLDKDQAKLPVRLSCLDPLQRIRTVKLDIWAGKPAPVRAPSLTEPKPVAGDGPRRAVVVNYRDGTGQVDVPIPSLAAGQVLWIQPVLTDSGDATHWGSAVVYSPSDLPPLERKEALITENFERQGQRTIKLTASVTAHVSKGTKQTLYRDSMEVEALETAQKEARGGRLSLFPGARKFTITDMNGKVHPLTPDAQALLRGRSMTFHVDPQGALLQRTVPVLTPNFALELREDFEDLVHKIANSYEMTCLPVPNRKIQAQESWEARVPLILTYQGRNQRIVDMLLTCTYEGTRVQRGQTYAVVTLSGTVKGRKPDQRSAGIVTGKAHFALDDGYLALANIKVESESGDDDLTLMHSFEMSMTRVPGNNTGIIAAPVAVPGAQPGTGTDYELAVPHLQRRDFDQAIPLLEKAVAANPNLVKAQNDLGFAYNEKRLFDKAIPCFKKVLQLDPRHANALNNLGFAYNAKGLHDEAIPCFKKVLEINPNHAITHDNLGTAYGNKGLLDEAIASHEKAVELEPQRSVFHSNLGFALNRKRLYDRGIVSLKRAIELDSKNGLAHHFLGFAYNAKGLYDDAIPCFKKVLELNANFAPALNNLGFAYNAKGLYDQGIPWLKKSVDVNPKDAVACENLGVALIETGDLQTARDVLKKALAQTPENAPQFQGRKKLLEQAENLLRLEAGIADLAKGETKPKNFMDGLQFGKVCRVKGYYAAATRYYEDALANDPDAAKKLAHINFLILARTSLLASAGQGTAPLPEAERPKYRAKALGWLQKFLKAQQEDFEKDAKTGRYPCQHNLRVLLQHKDLARVRAGALKDLPDAERKEWEGFWNDVEILLEKADALSPDP